MGITSVNYILPFNFILDTNYTDVMMQLRNS